MLRRQNEIEKTISDEIQIYAEKNYSSQLVTLMLTRGDSLHASVFVDSLHFFESNNAFAHLMFQNPQKALKLLNDAFQKVSLKISKSHALKTDMVYKENLRVRLIYLPNLPEVYHFNLPNCSDVGQFLCVSGTVVKNSTGKIQEYKKLWRCSKCKHQFIVEAQVEQDYAREKPVVCQNPIACPGKNFTMMSNDVNSEWCKEYQQIKLQEQVNNLNVGTRSMWVILEDDLVDTCQPGNDVIVSGILIQQWKPLIRGLPISIELAILAHNIEVQNKMTSAVVSKEMVQEFVQFWIKYKSDPLSGRNFVLSSICPQVFGLYIVKLAVALVLAGGVEKKIGNSRIRGDSHLLLIGDPGTAKSQFLKFATEVSARSVLTSGIGTTNAGLTVSAVKESGRWELEAGALVLADGGICCIDEFSCINEQDKTCIHEAMEQQTISVAKAGLVCRLNTRCSIFASTNPKGKYDETMSISENTALGTPLLSRFDIILVLLDTYEKNWDDMVASYIIEGRNIERRNNSILWPISKIKSYFTLIRHINPRVTPEAERVLRSYYTKQRSLQSRNASRTTPRLLQSLIRLAEGHARLMFRAEVLVLDAVIAIVLVESSMLGNSILEGLNPLHTVFPDSPFAEYQEKAEAVFQNLNIETPKKENYNIFYEESNLNSLLCGISDVWSSKSTPCIFSSPSCNNFTDSTQYQETFLSACENTSDQNTAETTHMFHKRAGESILYQILEEPNCDENTDTISRTANIFNNVPSRKETSSSIGNVDLRNDETTIANKAENYEFERSVTDIFEDLGLSPTKEQENNQILLTTVSTELSSSLPAANKIFPSKRSLADQLKSIAFSKASPPYQQNLLRDKPASVNKENSRTPGTSLVLNKVNSKETLKRELSENDKTSVNEPAKKKPGFKRIVEWSRSQSNIKTVMKVNSSETLCNTQSLRQFKDYGSCSITVKDTSNASETENFEAHSDSQRNSLPNKKTLETHNNNCVAGSSSCKTTTKTDNNTMSGRNNCGTDSLSPVQLQASLGKKPVSEKLKKFVFSKSKTSKSPDSFNSINEE